jgi:hypothetical protein
VGKKKQEMIVPKRYFFCVFQNTSKLIGYGQDGRDFAICEGFGFNVGFNNQSNL